MGAAEASEEGQVIHQSEGRGPNPRLAPPASQSILGQGTEPQIAWQPLPSAYLSHLPTHTHVCEWVNGTSTVKHTD